jgi:hypothetical protein
MLYSELLYKFKKYSIFTIFMGIGDWGLGIGPNPQSPIPNPQSPYNFILFLIFKFIHSKKLYFIIIF